ncbi:MAG: transporter substrate-binding domain-containing protein [Ramlibacter sp.]
MHHPSRIRRAVLALALSAGAFAQAQPLDGTLKKIQDTGTITLATRTASVPFNYLDDDNRQAGYAWEIAQRVTERVRQVTGRADLKIRTVEVTPQTRIPLVANQTVDLECSSTTHNLERENQVGFSVSYFATGARLLVRAGSPVQNWKDLKGVNVAVGAGTTTERLLRQMNEQQQLGANVLLAPDINEGFLMLESGRAGALMQDAVGLYAVGARLRNPDQWKVVGDALEPEAYGCMLRKGDTRFKALVDDTIVGMMKSGEMRKLYDKYFNAPLKLRGGLNLNMPMQPLIDNLIKNPSDKAL